MQEVLNLSPGGAPLAQSLGFTAATVIVDNLTSSYVTLSDVGKTIPPWIYGAVVALPPGLKRASAKLTATTPAIPGPPVPISQATLTWTDQPLPAAPGHPLQQVTTSQQTVIATLSAPAGQATGAQIFPVPAGTQSIGYIVRTDGANVTPSALFIIGIQSDNEYTGATPPNDVGGAQWYPFAITDTSVELDIAAPAGGPSHVDFLASPLALALDVQQSFGTVPTAALTDSNGNFIDIDNPAVGVEELGVSMFHATPALWQAATAFVRFAATINAGATASLRAGVAGQVIRIFGPVFTSDAGAGNATDVISIEDSAGNVVEDFRNTSAIQPGCPGPLPLAIGNGVRLHNFSAANLAVRCTFGISQG